MSTENHKLISLNIFFIIYIKRRYGLGMIVVAEELCHHFCSTAACKGWLRITGVGDSELGGSLTSFYVG